MTHMWKCLQIYCNIYPLQGMQEDRRKKTLRKPVGGGKVGDICRLQEGTSWGMWGGGGGVVVVGWWWDLHEGRPARFFFGGGCTVVGSWGVWAVWWLGAARRGGFWRLQIWWPVSLALHCKSMQGQADWPPFRRFCSVTNFYFSKFFSGGDTRTRRRKLRMAMSYACPMR